MIPKNHKIYVCIYVIITENYLAVYYDIHYAQLSKVRRTFNALTTVLPGLDQQLGDLKNEQFYLRVAYGFDLPR